MKQSDSLLQSYFNTHRYAALFEGNGHVPGFYSKLQVSNLNPVSQTERDKDYLAFISYDYKNKLETFTSKNTNPLSFPDHLLIEVEKTISLDAPLLNEGSIQPSNILIEPTVTRQQYMEQVNRLKKHIQQGDIYEINYCITFEAHNVILDPLATYQKLNAISKASYSAVAKFDHQYIICSSPELYFSKQGDTLTSKPIKGTAKRGVDEQNDQRIKEALTNSLKERTENVMIVDVVRNDFSRLAQRGTVTVEKLFDIETYQQLHQMVSTVTCKVNPNVSLDTILNATFPMASMTGAPKIRAMQLADDYERYNRGPYSGTLGYITAKNDIELNVLIRSIFYDEAKHYLSFSVGSAITSLCNAEEEYEECLLKAKAMRQALEQ